MRREIVIAVLNVVYGATPAPSYGVPVIQPMSFGTLNAEDVIYDNSTSNKMITEPRIPETYKADCYLPLDVMFLQDTTGSFHDDLPNVIKQIPSMVAEIVKQHPKSWFGVAEFRDKPFEPLGLLDDFCYRLGDSGLSGDVNKFQKAYEKLFASGGEDLPEAQYQALIDVSLDQAVGWRPLAPAGTEAASGEAGARLIIMSTDAKPHDPKDCSKYDPEIFTECPRDLPTNSGTISTGSIEYECIKQDYPSCYQMKDVLQGKSLHLAILTPEDSEIIPVWRWVNEELLEQPAEYYQYIRDDSLDMAAGVLAALKSVTETLCPATTPKPPPTLTTSLTEATTRSTRTTASESTTERTVEETTSSSAFETTEESVPTGRTETGEANTSTTTEPAPCTPCCSSCKCCCHGCGDQEVIHGCGCCCSGASGNECHDHCDHGCNCDHENHCHHGCRSECDESCGRHYSGCDTKSSSCGCSDRKSDAIARRWDEASECDVL